MTPIISVEHLSKAYRLGIAEKRHDTLASALVHWIKAPFRNFRNLSDLNLKSRSMTADADSADSDNQGIHWALRDVSFEVQEGEVVGIIGRNGAGKSTLLKILSRITEPTSGRAVIRGRVSSLLEVGTGFHPELSGRDNVYMNGTILGMRRREIDQKFDEIVAFSGVEKFIDTPVKRYSSGMKVRLAFAVAAHLEPEILVIDEVLAVGDQDFQDKCLGKMRNVAGSGRTVLFVSHNMAAVEGLCSSGILLDQGTVICTGTSEECIRRYYSPASSGRIGRINLVNHPNRTIHSGRLFSFIRLSNAAGNDVTDVRLGEELRIEIWLSGNSSSTPVCVGIHFHDQMSRRIATCHTTHQLPQTFDTRENLYVRCEIPEIWFLPGEYSIVLGIASGADQLDRIDPAVCFTVSPSDVFGTGRLPQSKDGVIVLKASWQTLPAENIPSL